MNRFSLTTYTMLTVLTIGSVVVVNFWVGLQLNDPLPAVAPVVSKSKEIQRDQTRPRIDKNGMLVPIGAAMVDDPAVNSSGGPQPQQPESPPKKFFEGPAPDTMSGELAG